MATQKVYGRTRTEQGTASDEAVTKAQLDGHSHPAQAPAAHAASHASTGSDQLTPTSIGAVPNDRAVNAGRGLTGGGMLNADRGFAVNFAPNGEYFDGLAVEADDLRLSNARTPTAHKTSHATGGTDALTPGDIGAAVSGHTHAPTDLGTFTAVSPFAGSLRFLALAGGTVIMGFGNISRATGFSGTFTDTGIVVPTGYRPPSSETFAAHTFYNSTATYRFRIASTGELAVQMSAANSTNMTMDNFWFTT